MDPRQVAKLTRSQTLCREAESYVSQHPTSKHQCTHLGSAPNLNSQASSPISEGWKPPYHIENRRRNVSQKCCEWRYRRL